MKQLILLVGMVFVIEGLPYVAAPEAMREWLKKLSEFEPKVLRKFGIALMVIGFIICWAVQKS